MSAPTVDMKQLDADIADAMAEVRGARAAWAHSPNPDTVAAEKLAERRLNKLLEFRFTVQQCP